MTRPEPQFHVARRRDIPEAPPQFPKFYWDTVIGKLEQLEAANKRRRPFDEEVLVLPYTTRVGSAIAEAGRRSGYIVSSAMRDGYIYLWIAGRCKPAEKRIRRAKCKVCGQEIKVEHLGATPDVCQGWPKASRCQRIRDYARVHKITFEEAEKHLYGARCEICGGIFERNGAQRVCAAKPGEESSDCYRVLLLMRFRGMSKEAAIARAALNKARRERRERRKQQAARQVA